MADEREPPTLEDAQRGRRVSRQHMRDATEFVRDATGRWEKYHSAIADRPPAAPKADAERLREDHEYASAHREACRDWTRAMGAYVGELSHRAHRMAISNELLGTQDIPLALHRRRQSLNALLGPDDAQRLVDAVAGVPREEAQKLVMAAGLLYPSGEWQSERVLAVLPP